jgi:Ras-related protein Rab-1A
MKTEIRNNDSKDAKDDIEYKLILLGDTSVGKTCLFKKLTTGIFMDKNVSTVGIDRRTITVDVDVEENNKIVTKKIILNIIDTAGQERFKAITKTYYKGSDGAVLLYDITEKKSFEHINAWIESIKTSASDIDYSKYSVLLLGSKIDLVESGKKEREVDIEDAKSKCDDFKLEWGGECSNKDFTQEKYIEIFKDFVKIIYKRIGAKEFKQQASIKLEIKPRKKQSNCPCIIF